MKSTAAKSLHILLALFIFGAALAPVCSGSETCSMPCCRHQAQPVSHPPVSHPPVSHPMDRMAGEPCCNQTADDPADHMSGCRFEKNRPALTSGVESISGMTPAVSTVVFQDPIGRSSHPPLVGSMDSRPPSVPLYLHLQTLLI